MLRRIEVNSANRSLPGRYKLLLAAILLSVLAFAAWQPIKNRLYDKPAEIGAESGIDETGPDAADVNHAESNGASSDLSKANADQLSSTPTDELANDAVNEYIISSGDTLAKVLEAHDVGFKDVFLLTKKFPALEKDLRPGQVISWSINDDGHLQNLTWTVNRKETRLYDLSEEDGYIESLDLTKGEWKEMVFNGEIGQDGNVTLCGSAIAAGLTSRECHNAARYLQSQVNLNALRMGDKFAVLLEREFVNDEHTASRLLAAKMNSRKKDRYIVYFDKYRAYYDDRGRPLTEGFLRIPTSSDKQYRISSSFNPRRLHPVTKRIAPHNGVDFAMPVGTPLVAAGDGEIMIARFSPTAGNYVAIRHGKQYSTRYLHMSKITVRAGQIVKRGDLIGYSGNTGRSTGAHLHYEFLVDNKAVDPMKMTLPRPEGLKNGDLDEFVSYADLVKVKFAESEERYKAERARLLEDKRLAEEKRAAEAEAAKHLSSETIDKKPQTPDEVFEQQAVEMANSLADIAAGAGPKAVVSASDTDEAIKAEKTPEQNSPDMSEASEKAPTAMSSTAPDSTDNRAH